MSRPGQNSRYRCVSACVCVCAEAVCHEMCFTSGPKGALTSGYVPSLLANPPPTLQKTPEKKHNTSNVRIQHAPHPAKYAPAENCE